MLFASCRTAFGLCSDSVLVSTLPSRQASTKMRFPELCNSIGNKCMLADVGSEH
jgi:hypothetical protein